MIELNDNFNYKPKLPPEIKAARDKELVLFIGAGASILTGLPSWKTWAEAILKDLCVSEDNKLNYFELEQLKNLDPRKQLSIAKILREDIDLTKGLKGKENTESLIYHYLQKFNCIYVTTNYDELLDNDNRQIIYQDINEAHLRQDNIVIHLHGSIREPSTMKVTTKEYLDYYANTNSNDTNPIRNFLKILFDTKVVLFIGYGLEEVEILEQIMRWGDVKNAQSEDKPIRRFMLQGFFSGEQSLYDKLSHYYLKSFGVKLIGFIKDKKDYNQLEDVIKDWTGELYPSSMAEEVDKIYQVLDNDNT